MSTQCGITRRRALCVGAAGITAAFGVSRSAALAHVNANEQVSIGVIGVGRRAQQLIASLTQARVVAVCDVDRVKSESVAATHKCAAYSDYRKLLDSRDVDAVIVATADHWHALPAIHACQAGKDVYCEKPLSLTVVEGRRMVEAARKYDRVFQTGSQQRSMAANRLACSFVRDGGLGNIRRVVAHNYSSPWECALPEQPAPKSLDWNAWCGPAGRWPFHEEIYRPRGNPGWISFRPFSGGEMTGWGAHGLDQVQWALNKDDGGPEEIWTEGEPFEPPTFDKPASRTVADQTCSRPKVSFRYADGVVVVLDDGPPGGARFEGANGTLTIDRGRFVANPKLLAATLDAELRANPSSASATDTVDHMRNWIDCIKSRQRPVADVAIGHRTATLCHLGNIARWTQRKLRWNAADERFVGDAEANALLDREHRKPYELPDRV